MFSIRLEENLVGISQCRADLCLSASNSRLQGVLVGLVKSSLQAAATYLSWRAYRPPTV